MRVDPELKGWLARSSEMSGEPIADIVGRCLRRAIQEQDPSILVPIKLEEERAARKVLDENRKWVLAASRGKFKSLEAWGRSLEGEQKDVDRDVMRNIGRLYARRHEDGQSYSKADELRWAENILRTTGRTLGISPGELLARCQEEFKGGAR